jgi:phosphatidylglycerophosphate synthase
MLLRLGIRPNHVSVASVGFAALSATCYALLTICEPSTQVALLLVAAVGLQLRLLCNLMDGMLAVEGGMRSKAGDLYNDVPDRIADLLVLVGTGYAISWIAWGRELGWAAGTLAVVTAYARLLGGSLHTAQHFVGPMAKQHRMAVLTVASALSTVEVAFGFRGRILAMALGIIVVGSTLTAALRLRLIARELEAQ